VSKPYYQDDWTTIYCGYCRDILPELPKVDLVLTDPPYGIGEDYSRNMSRGKLAPSGCNVLSRAYGQYDWDKKD
jgi:DNA modification methylase